MEFLDIGSYGIWGEWHPTHPAPVAVRKQIVDMYLQAFPKDSPPAAAVGGLTPQA